MQEPFDYEKLLHYFYQTEMLITDICNTLEGRDDSVREWIQERYNEIKEVD